MNINQKAKDFATYIKSTDEFKLMNKCKHDLEKNRSLKRQLDNYLNKKNNICSTNNIQEVSMRMNTLNKEYEDFFSLPLVSAYMESTKRFNSMMEALYKSIEKELLK